MGEESKRRTQLVHSLLPWIDCEPLWRKSIGEKQKTAEFRELGRHWSYKHASGFQ